VKRIYLALIIVSTMFYGCQKGTGSGKDSLTSFADSLFQTNVDSSFIAGASVVVFYQGEKVLDKSYGYASLELSVPMPQNPCFEIGSVTKQFTSAAIIRLMEQGKLSLDDDLSEYLDFDTRGRSVSINQLLNHTSGIASYTELPAFRSLSIQKYERDSLVRLVEKSPFLFEPGEALIYNNSGYFLLGLIIEKVSGMSYEEYLNEQIFGPLGMNHTFYSSNTKVIPGKVYGYHYSRNGLIQKPYIDHTWPYAAGSLASTTNDLLKWLQAMHEGRLFSDELYELYITPGELNDGSKVRYAMGLTNFSDYGHPVISHGGGIHGFLSDTRYYTEDDLYIICLVNTMGPKGADFFADELTWKILDKKEYPYRAPDVDPEQFAGKYSGQVRGNVLSVNVAALPDAFVLYVEGEEEEADTLRTYAGNNSWVEANDIIMFKDDELRLDQIIGYYRLKKE
jgi:CubicO group peptidase (beta-lactamase class C family)